MSTHSMAELISLQNVTLKTKQKLLKELGYTSDGTFIFDEKGRQVKDKYIEEPVTIENMIILPGSTVILDDNPLSIASYMEEYGDIF